MTYLGLLIVSKKDITPILSLIDDLTIRVRVHGVFVFFDFPAFLHH